MWTIVTGLDISPDPDIGSPPDWKSPHRVGTRSWDDFYHTGQRGGWRVDWASRNSTQIVTVSEIFWLGAQLYVTFEMGLRTCL